MVRGEDDQRLVELAELAQPAHQAADLLVRRPGVELEVRLVVRVGVVVGDAAPHVARLVDRAQREQHAAPRLALHHGQRGVGGPDVAAEMRGVGADGEAVAVERVHPGRRRGRGAVRQRGRRVDVEAAAGGRRDVGRDVEAGRPAPVVDAVAVAVEVAAGERDRDVAGRAVRRVDGVVLLADGDELGARLLGVQVVGELRVALVADQRVELVARQRAGDPHRVRARAEHVVAVAERLVGPAHVLREPAAGDHVVRDHGLGRHVAEVGVLEVDAVAHQGAHVAHVELVDEVRPELVEHEDQDPLGRLRLPVSPCGRRDAQQDQQANHYDRYPSHGPSSGGRPRFSQRG